MLRSFDYAAAAALRSGRVRAEDVALLRPAADAWALWVQAAFLDEYLTIVAPANLLPRGDHDLRLLLDFLVLDKAVYELDYELNNRPGWVHVPLEGILRLLAGDAAAP
jgi:maltose alpha-D-glucosyltransferase/alpha-amylase